MVVKTLVDSGADSNFIDTELVRQNQIGTIPLDTPLMVIALNGEVLPHISHETVPIPLLLAGYHNELIGFHGITLY